jgi:hypothetical protein
VGPITIGATQRRYQVRNQAEVLHTRRDGPIDSVERSPLDGLVHHPEKDHHMSTKRYDLDATPIDELVEPAWFTSLVHQTTQLDNVGVRAAVLSLRLQPRSGESDAEKERRAVHVRNLLGRLLRPTDRMGQTSPTTFAVLLTPLQTIVEAASHIHAISDSLQDAGLLVSAGFAHRRDGESLLDTWARAEAQADRAAFRSHIAEGLHLSD